MATQANDLEARALAYRDEFAVLKRQTYLINASLGPLSNRSRAHLDNFLDLWAAAGSPDVVWFENIFPTYDRIRALVARMIGARAHEVALTNNISIALSSLASFFDWKQRPKVVITELDFPTDHHVWHANRARGIEVVTVPSRDGIGIETQDVVDAIDERTQLVQVNRVLYQSGAIMDLEAIAARAHEMGAYVAVDDFHGAGVLPIDVWRAGADFYMTAVLKWLMGGGGLGFLVVREDLIPKFESQVTGWWAQKPESYFSSQRDLQDDARRFETGTTAGPVAYLALGGLEIVDEFGVENVRARHVELTSYAYARATEMGLDVRSPARAEDRGGLIRVMVPDSKRIFRALLERNIVCDERAGGLRIAPHFFSTTGEIDVFFDALRTLL
jgi:kynureninase